MRGQSIHIERERDTYGVRAAQLGKRIVKVFPAPQRNRFFDKAGKKQPEDTGEKLRSAAISESGFSVNRSSFFASKIFCRAIYCGMEHFMCSEKSVERYSGETPAFSASSLAVTLS